MLVAPPAALPPVLVAPPVLGLEPPVAELLPPLTLVAPPVVAFVPPLDVDVPPEVVPPLVGTPPVAGVELEPPTLEVLPPTEISTGSGFDPLQPSRDDTTAKTPADRDELRMSVLSEEEIHSAEVPPGFPRGGLLIMAERDCSLSARFAPLSQSARHFREVVS